MKGFRNFRFQKVHAASIIVLTAIVSIGMTGLLFHQKGLVAAHQDTRTDCVQNKSKRTEAGVSLGGSAGKPRISDAESIQLDLHSIRNAKIDSATAQKILARIKLEIKDVRLQAALSGAVLSNLCNNGSVSDAWRLIDGDPGLIRESQFVAFFSVAGIHSKDSIEKYFKEISGEKDRGAAIMGLVNGNLEIALTLDHSIIPGSSDFERASFVRMINSLQKDDQLNAFQASSTLIACAEMTAVGLMNPHHLLSLFEFSRHLDPFECWTVMNNIKDFSAVESGLIVRKGLARQMVIADSDKALAMLCTDPQTRYSYPVLSAAFGELFNVSSERANRWLGENLAGLDPATSQRIISSVSQIAAKTGDFEVAESWADQILNQEVKTDLINQIEQLKSKGNP